MTWCDDHDFNFFFFLIGLFFFSEKNFESIRNIKKLVLLAQKDTIVLSNIIFEELGQPPPGRLVPQCAQEESTGKVRGSGEGELESQKGGRPELPTGTAPITSDREGDPEGEAGTLNMLFLPCRF